MRTRLWEPGDRAEFRTEDGALCKCVVLETGAECAGVRYIDARGAAKTRSVPYANLGSVPDDPRLIEVPMSHETKPDHDHFTRWIRAWYEERKDDPTRQQSFDAGCAFGMKLGLAAAAETADIERMESKV